MPSLTWLTREADLRRAASVPYRLLEADPELSRGDASAQNMLIQGDNLDALKALLPYYKGRVKCIYIDPPYNTRSAFEQYDDNLEHTQWLAMMYPRLELLRDLLSEDGSIWVNLDENEGHYAKVLCDEIFGRTNFVRQINWQRKYSVSNNFKGIATICDLIFVYRKSPAFQNNLLPRSEDASARYVNPDNDPRGPWKAVDYLNQASVKNRPNLVYDITNPFTGEIVKNKEKAWKYEPATHAVHVLEKRLWWGLKGENSVPALKLFLSEVRDGMTPHNWWPHAEVGHTDEAKKETNLLFGRDDGFDTPKPERLIKRVLDLATKPGDLVLDSFLGSGTTAAVAHKMGRRWIGIEVGEHAVSHCVPRLTKVIEGEQGGVSESVSWQGGGGYKFYRLGEEVFDEEGRIRSGIEYPALAAHIWFSETGVPYTGAADSPFLGTYGTRGFALLYNGILGDKSATGGNVLTGALLASIRALAAQDGPFTIYGEASRIGEARLKAEGVTFKQTPYDVKAR